MSVATSISPGSLKGNLKVRCETIDQYPMVLDPQVVPSLYEPCG